MGQFLGGLLQAALTIFGVVGGPVFGMFTLGMFTRLGNQRGAIVGLLTSLVFSLWIGFGQPKPPIPNKVNVNGSGCGYADAYYDHEKSSNLHFEYQWGIRLLFIHHAYFQSQRAFFLFLLSHDRTHAISVSLDFHHSKSSFFFLFFVLFFLCSLRNDLSLN